MKPHVVIGGGIGGLVAAWSLRQRFLDAPIVVLEQAPMLGGLLTGTRYPDAGLHFDLGTHIFQETGDAGIDRFIFEAIPSDWLVQLPPQAGDLAGAVFNDRLQDHSHFPDLRFESPLREMGQSVIQHAASPSFSADIVRGAPLVEVARRRFGRGYADACLIPLLAAMYGVEADELAAFALLLPGLTRVLALDAPEWEKTSDNPALRAVIGYPEQRELPDAFRHGRRSFYTRRDGALGVIHALAADLAQRGVSLRPNSTIQALDPASLTLTYLDAERNPQVLEAEGIVIATGVFGAARLLGVPVDGLGLAPPLLHRVVNLQLEKPVGSDLHYFHDLDTTNTFYRVTNYRGFSGNPADRRLSVEVLERAELPDADLPRLVLEALRRVGLFLNPTRASFARVERVPKGFPRPTVANLEGLAQLQAHVRERLPPGILVGGAVGDGLFFTNEIIVDLHRAIQSAPVR